MRLKQRVKARRQRQERSEWHRGGEQRVLLVFRRRAVGRLRIDRDRRHRVGLRGHGGCASPRSHWRDSSLTRARRQYGRLGGSSENPYRESAKRSKQRAEKQREQHTLPSKKRTDHREQEHAAQADRFVPAHELVKQAG